MSRKDDHILFAYQQEERTNDFDKVRFEPVSLPKLSYDEIDCSTSLGNHRFEYPIYINAMTGGTDKAYEINQKLAVIAKTFGLPIATGSLSIALKDDTKKDSFQVIRQTFEDGFVIANIGVSKSPEGAQKAIDIVQANALQVHLNAPQEMMMPEGERDFSCWGKNLQKIIEYVNVPVIIKDVGFGISLKSAETLKALGATIIDVSGKGGTNFIEVENKRRAVPLTAFEHYGFSTVEALLEMKSLKDVTILASGGIRNPYDVIKALALGAKAVGLSGFFLKLVMDHPIDRALELTQIFLEDIKKIMTVLDAKDIKSLQQKKLIFDHTLLAFIAQQKN
ncbi:MAG: type 2 isopentenyl-diphosphate Delta-isomerase [Acholeplasmataceae bacterium]